jgi:hypothetical protein
LARATPLAIIRLTRSRRLALVLIAAIGAYAFIATLIPQGGTAALPRWRRSQPVVSRVASALGLTDAWNSPIFLVPVGLLALATASCAWERSALSIRALRRGPATGSGTGVSPGRKPDAVVKLGRGQGEEKVLADVAKALRKRRMKVRMAGGSLDAEAGRFGLAGSPFFHWTLAILLLVIGFGRLTRSAGLIGLPIGDRVADARGSYGYLKEGPLYLGRPSGLTLVASDFLIDYKSGGVDRGPSPVLSLYKGSVLVSRSRIFPNHPLSYGSLLVHMNAVGLAPLVALEDPQGREISRQRLLIDFSKSQPRGTDPVGLNLLGATGEAAYTAMVVAPADGVPGSFEQKMPADPRVEVTIEKANGGPAETNTLRPGQAMSLPTGDKLRVVSLGYYSRVLVADDWSVQPMYVLFALSLAGVSLALLASYRRVKVRVFDRNGRREIRVFIAGRRQDLAFKKRLSEAVREAALGGQRPPSRTNRHGGGRVHGTQDPETRSMS